MRAMSDLREVFRPLSRAEGDKVLLAWLAGLKRDISKVVLDLAETTVTDEGVKALAEHCQQLRTLDLAETTVTDKGVKALAKHCQQLHALNLKSAAVTDEGVTALAERCQQLHTLNLKSTAVTGEGVKALALHCRQLQTLHLSDKSVSDEGVKALAEYCQQLHTLNLSSKSVTDKQVKLLARRCQQLRFLEILECENVTDEGVRGLAMHCNQLHTLNLWECRDVTDEGLLDLAIHCKQLRELHLSGDDVTDKGVYALAQNCNQIHTLDLAGTSVTDEGVKVLAQRCKQLHTLDLGHTIVTDEGIEALAHRCKQIHTLKLAGTALTDGGLATLAQRCQQLRSLTLWNCEEVTDEGAKALAQNCHQLDTLELWGCEEVTDEGVKALAERCQQLHTLNLEGMGVTDEGVKALAQNCRGLQTLDLAETAVTDEGVKALAEGCRQLQTLNLTETAVTDEGVKALAQQCQQLYVLRLDSTSVTGDGVKTLSQHCQQLFRLDLNSVEVDLPETLRATSRAQAILQYYREARMPGSRALLEVKVAILGIGRLGKSQLARRLAPHTEEERTRPYVRDAQSTHAFEQRVAKLRVPLNRAEHECLLRLFDFGGQPEMHGAHRFFLADQRNVYIVLVSARKSRAANRLDYWLRMVKHHGGGAPAVVVVSHNDTEPAADERVYRPPAEALEILNARKLAEEHAIPVQVVDDYSNVTGENLHKVWRALSDAVSSLRKVFDVPFSPDFFKVHAWVNGTPKEELQAQPVFDRYLSVRTFQAACAAAGQKDELQQRIWLVLLRDLGLLHYVGDRPEVRRDPKSELSEFLYHPEWVKKPVYNVVRHQDAYENNGVLPFSRLSNAIAIDVRRKGDRKRIVALMEACELIFRVRGGDPEDADYLIVDRIPGITEGMDRENWTSHPKKKLRWVFSFLSDHLLAQLLGRWFSHVPAATPYFRDDIVLVSRDETTCQVRIRTRVHEHMLDMEFDAHRDKDWEKLLTRLESEIESILDPEGLKRVGNQLLWNTIDPDQEPVNKLTMEEMQTVTRLAETVCQSRSLDTESNLFNAIRRAIEQGFEASLSMREGEKRAYRACWVFTCHRCMEEETRLDEAVPVAGDLAEMEKVISWLEAVPNVKAILLGSKKGKTLDTPEALRGSYRNALKRLPQRRPSQIDIGDLRKHAARPDLSRDQ